MTFGTDIFTLVAVVVAVISFSLAKVKHAAVAAVCLVMQHYSRFCCSYYSPSDDTVFLLLSNLMYQLSLFISRHTMVSK